MFWMVKEKEVSPVIKEFYALGTVLQFKVFGKRAEAAITAAMNKINEIDDKMSVFKEYSELSAINKNAGQKAVKVSEDTFFVLKKAIKYSELSEGAFDVTIRPIVGLWGVQTKHPTIPEEQKLKQDTKLVNYKDIVLNEAEKTAYLKNVGQALDVGAIAKGYATDKAKEIVVKHKIKNAILDLGGNVYAVGSKVNGELWSIGIQDPKSDTGDYIGTIGIKNKSVVTSGNYERFFEKDGKKFHHIMNPSTGKPSENGIISTTIVSEDSIDGDALSTCVYVLGIEKGLELLKSTKGVEAIIITEDKKIYLTSGIKDSFKLFKKEYKLNL